MKTPSPFLYALFVIIVPLLLSSCKKGTYPNTSGNFAGILTDSLTTAAGLPGIDDTMIITSSGGTIHVTDKNTGATFSGTLGPPSASTSEITSTPVTINGAVIKQGASSTVYNTVISGNNYFQTTTLLNTSSTSVSIEMTDAAGSTFSFDGNSF